LKVSDNLRKHFLPIIEEIERSFEREIPDLVIGLRDFPEKANRKYWSTDSLQTPKSISACSKKKREDAQKSLKEMGLEYGNRFGTIRTVTLHLGYQLRDKNKEGNFQIFPFGRSNWRLRPLILKGSKMSTFPPDASSFCFLILTVM
jgi:hypothetical protein